MEWGSDFGNLDDVSNKYFLGSVSSDKNFEFYFRHWQILICYHRQSVEFFQPQYENLYHFESVDKHLTSDLWGDLQGCYSWPKINY